MIFGSQYFGSVQVIVAEHHGEVLLCDLATEGIALWDIRREDGTVSFSVATDDLPAVRRVALARGCHIRLGRRHGLLFVRKGMKKRKGLWLTAMAVFLALWMTLSVAWDRELLCEDGGALTAEERQSIEDAADDLGLTPPLLKSSVRSEQVSAELQKRCPFLSWVSVSPEGMTLVIRTAKKSETVEEQGDHGHIVAEKDGTVLKILVLKGQKQAEPHTEVKQGDILISGDLVYEEEGKDPVYGKTAAKGSVIALVRYAGTAYVPLTEVTFVPTGKTAGIVTLGKDDDTVTLWGYDGDPFRHSLISERSVSLFGWELRSKTYREAVPKKTELTLEEALRRAEKEAGQQAEMQIPDDAIIVSRVAEEIVGEDGTVGMRVILECEEEIGIFVPIP